MKVVNKRYTAVVTNVRNKNRLDNIKTNHVMGTKYKTKEDLLAELDNLHKQIELSNLKVQKEIQKQKQAIVLSEKNESRFREVLENSIGASYKRDLKTNSYEYLSPVFTKITGYTPEEMMNLPLETILGLIHPDDIPETNSIIQKSLTPPFGDSNKIEYRFKDKRNGTYHWLCDQYRVMFDSKGNPTAFIGSVSDVSEQKEYEKNLLKAMKDLESNYINLGINREIKMVELKNEINELSVRLGEGNRYGI